MKDNRFNLLSTQQKNTLLQSNIQKEEERDDNKPERLTSAGYSRIKRKYNDLETSSRITDIRPLNNLNTVFSKGAASALPSVNLRLKEEKEKTIFSKPAPLLTKVSQQQIATKEKSVDTLEKYFYMDERYVETDRNISNTHNLSKDIFNLLGFEKKANDKYLIKSTLNYPGELFQKFKGEKEKFSFSGLFVPLNLVYFVRNNLIYLWNYKTNNLVTYDQIDNIIVNLHITLPQPGVFLEIVNCYLILGKVYYGRVYCDRGVLVINN
jgi:hypothetical protein